MISDAQIERIVAHLEDEFGLDALVVFGSRGRGSARPDSDLDLAALLRRRAAPSELLDAEAELGAVVGCEVDLVDLDTASPILAMQALRDGRCVAGASSPRMLAFRAGLPGRYEDVKRTRAEAEAALVRRIVDAEP